MGILSPVLLAKEADIGNRKNRLSFDYGPFLGYLASGDLPFDVNYERLLHQNLALHLSGGVLLIHEEPSTEYWSLQTGIRKYWFGDHQRLSLGVLPLAEYWKHPWAQLNLGIPIAVGYTWQWNTLFTALETGFGPGYSLVDETWHYDILATGSLRFGFLF